MVAWPSSLPVEPLANSIGEQFDASLIITAMDTGPAKRRRRHTARADDLRITYRMTETQLTSFRSFYGTTINDGLTTYTIKHPITGSTITVGIMEPPTIQAVGGIVKAFDVGLVLQIQPA